MKLSRHNKADPDYLKTITVAAYFPVNARLDSRTFDSQLYPQSLDDVDYKVLYHTCVWKTIKISIGRKTAR